MGFEHVLDDKRHGEGEAEARFFRVVEFGHATNRNEGYSVSAFGVLKDCRGVAAGGERAPLGNEGFDEALAVGVFRQVPNGAVATGEKDRVKIGSVDFGQPDSVGEGVLGGRVFFEAGGCGGVRSGGEVGGLV